MTDPQITPSQMTARGATEADINDVHRELMDLIDSMPYYGERFKAYEKARFDRTFLRTLMAIDPWHVLLLETDGKTGGFLISGPANGTIFQFWSAIYPDFRGTPLGRFGMEAFISHWDNNRFHKASTYTRPDNRPALVLLKRFGYQQVAHLEDHIFGEDYFVMERKFTKSIDGYDDGIRLPLATRLKLKLKALSDR
ncbi:GNAT family N-acetyltransferase [Pelagibacterium luteolum]|uniref:Ribosomal protein S18 acetylase RimI n=1 Tax=Pelagibacterium luteolum TaxID=440168 RepID=A0A1G7UGD7_9HYPH|nr:GNAT family protein [Pelagibacterium luteolum]SDG46378.1 Ribosomal protein S18 acetylase RimI [Pelagibacterium luteolum]